MSSNEIVKIRNNSLVVFSFQFLSLLLNILSISLAARYLGVENFGKFNYLLAIVGISAKVIDFGFNPIIFREVSKDRQQKNLIGSAFVFRLIVIIISLILFITFGFLLNLSNIEILLISLLTINIILSNKFTNIRELLTIPFKIELKMYIPMFLILLDNLLFLVFVLLMPQFNNGIIYFTFIYAFSNLPSFIILSILSKKEFNFRLNFDITEVLYLFRESLPLIGFIVLSFLYTQIDILILEKISGTESVGIYSSALRLIIPLKIIPNALVISLFALIARNTEKRDYNNLILKFISKIFLLFSISFSILMIYNAKDIILLIFGEQYVSAYLPLQILSFSIFFDFFSFFVLDVFTAYNKQRYNLYFIIITTVGLLLLDIVFIPHYDFIAASTARVFSGLIGFFFLLIVLKKKISFSVKLFNLNLVFAVLLFIILNILLSNINPIIQIILSNIAFLVFVLIFKVFTNSEIEIIFKLIKNDKIKSIINKIYSL